jgi:hypothetical protein
MASIAVGARRFAEGGKSIIFIKPVFDCQWLPGRCPALIFCTVRRGRECTLGMQKKLYDQSDTLDSAAFTRTRPYFGLAGRGCINAVPIQHQ